jgi:hypothetical protein
MIGILFFFPFMIKHPINDSTAMISNSFHAGLEKILFNILAVSTLINRPPF